MKTVKLREAELADVYRLAPRLREQDVNEAWASHHLTGEGALLVSYFQSECSFAAVYEGRVLAMWGVARRKNEHGAQIWFLGSDEVADFSVTLFRKSRQFVREALEKYGYLMNYVDVRNVLSITWLYWLGFTFDEPAPFGKDGQLFYHFYAKEGEIQNVCGGSSGGKCVNGSGNSNQYGSDPSTGQGASLSL